MTTDKNRLISLRQIKKKFSKDIKYNMFYGIKDMVADVLRIKQNYSQLRKKEFWALDDIQFDLFSGEILGIVGANGSGKTTLMRVISGIYPLDHGSITALEHIKITPIFALRSGMRQLFTGRENIYIKGAMYGMTKAEIDQKVDFVADFSGLGDYLETPFGNYSSGMKARLAFSIAIATEPNVFIIDEALAVGDSVFKAKCYDFLKAYVQQPDHAVLFVSNNLDKVLKVANRLIVMEKGTIIKETLDIKAGLHFYIDNCLKHVSEEQRQADILSIQQYDL